MQNRALPCTAIHPVRSVSFILRLDLFQTHNCGPFLPKASTHTSQVLCKNVHAIVCLLKNAYGCRPLIKDSCIKVPLLFPYDEILTSFTCQQPSLLAPPPPYYDDACFRFYFVHNHLSLHSTTNALQRTCRRNVQVWNTVREKRGWLDEDEGIIKSETHCSDHLRKISSSAPIRRSSSKRKSDIRTKGSQIFSHKNFSRSKLRRRTLLSPRSMDGRWKSYTEQYSATNLASPFISTQNLPYGKFAGKLELQKCVLLFCM